MVMAKTPAEGYATPRAYIKIRMPAGIQMVSTSAAAKTPNMLGYEYDAYGVEDVMFTATLFADSPGTAVCSPPARQQRHAQLLSRSLNVLFSRRSSGRLLRYAAAERQQEGAHSAASIREDNRARQQRYIVHATLKIPSRHAIIARRIGRRRIRCQYAPLNII